MFPSCLDLTRSFNISLFISLLFIIPVANLRLPICIRIASLSVRFFFFFFSFFSAQQRPVLASKKKKPFCLFTFSQQFQEVKCKFHLLLIVS